MSLAYRHHTIDAGGVTLHAVERGTGTAVVMCHGFPGLWTSYRRQIDALADAGFRAVALDMRGYGESDRPEDPRRYAYSHITRDLVSVLDALGIERAVFVGHDFGAASAWNVAIRAPERVLGLVLLAVPYEPRRARERPSVGFAAMAREHFLHLHYFQAEGVAERELDPRPRELLTRLFHALSGGSRYLDVWKHPSEGRGYLDVLPEAPPLPWPWLDESDMRTYVEAFAKTGFRGGLNWYRALDANWEESEPFVGAKITCPTLFIAGSKDPVLEMSGPRALDRMKEFVPDLRGVHVLAGAGHFVQLERTDEVNRLLIDFLARLST